MSAEVTWTPQASHVRPIPLPTHTFVGVSVGQGACHNLAANKRRYIGRAAVRLHADRLPQAGAAILTQATTCRRGNFFCTVGWRLRGEVGTWSAKAQMRAKPVLGKDDTPYLDRLTAARQAAGNLNGDSVRTSEERKSRNARKKW
jgi:hypothetical protein